MPRPYQLHLLFITLQFLLSALLFSQTESANGPSGAGVTSMAMNDHSVFAVAGQVIYRSDDFGKTWAPSNKGLPPGAIESIAAIGNTILASSDKPYRTPIYRSIDNGNNWTLLPNVLPDLLNSLSYDSQGFQNPANSPNQIRDVDKLISRKDTFYAFTQDRVYYMTVKDSIWRPCPIQFSPIITAVHQSTPNQFFSNEDTLQQAHLLLPDNTILINTNEGIRRSNDFGKTWQNSSQGINTAIVRNIFSYGNYIFATTNHQLQRLGRSGWQIVKLDTNDHFGTLYALTQGNALFCLADHKFYCSMDTGTTWVILNAKNFQPESINSIGKDERNLYVGVSNQGVYLSKDYGINWTKIPTLHSNIDHVYNNTMGNLVLGPNQAPIFDWMGEVRMAIDPSLKCYTTDDFGKTWKKIFKHAINQTSSNLPFNFKLVTHCIPFGKNHLLFHPDGLFLLDAKTNHTSQITKGLNRVFNPTVNDSTYDYIRVYSQKDQVYLDGFSGIYHLNWLDSTWVLDNVNAFAHIDTASIVKVQDSDVEIEINPTKNFTSSQLEIETAVQKDNMLFAGTFSNGLFKSVDGGKTWRHVPSNIPKFFKSLIASGNNLLAFTSSSADRSYRGEGSELWISTNDGQSWVPIQINNARKWDIMECPMAFCKAGKRLFFRSNKGFLYISEDHGFSWTRIYETSQGQVKDFMLSGHKIILKTDSGIFVSNDNAKNWQLPTGFPVGQPVQSMIKLWDKVYLITDSITYCIEPNSDTFKIAMGLPANLVVYEAKQFRGIYFMATNSGILFSNDQCKTWKLGIKGSHPFHSKSFFELEDQFFAQTTGSISHFNETTLSFDGLKNLSGFTIANLYKVRSRMYAISDPDLIFGDGLLRLFYSDDDLKSWNSTPVPVHCDGSNWNLLIDSLAVFSKSNPLNSKDSIYNPSVLKNWNKLKASLGQSTLEFTADKHDLYLIDADSIWNSNDSLNNFICTKKKFFRVIDDELYCRPKQSANWSQITSFPESQHLGFLKCIQNKLFLSTDHGVLCSDDEGESWVTWTSLTCWPNGNLNYLNNAYYLRSNSGYFFYSSNGGKSWQIVQPIDSLRIPSFKTRIVKGGNFYYQGLFTKNDFEVNYVATLYSKDTLNWKLVDNGLPINSFIRFFVKRRGYHLAITQVGLFRSFNGGKSWKKVNSHRQISQIDRTHASPISKTKHHLSTYLSKLYVSHNFGHDSVEMKSQIDTSYYWNEDWNLVHLGTDWFAYAKVRYDIGPFLKGQYAYIRSSNNGKTWTPPQTGLGTGFNFMKVIGSKVVACNSCNYFSDDAGRTWSSICPSLQVDQIYVQIVKGNIIYALTLDGNVFRSDNAGKDWRYLVFQSPEIRISRLIDAGDHICFAGFRNGEDCVFYTTSIYSNDLIEVKDNGDNLCSINSFHYHEQSNTLFIGTSGNSVLKLKFE